MADFNNSITASGSGAGLPWKIFVFAAILFGTVLASYFGLIWGYRPYLDGRIAAVQSDIDALAQSVTVAEQNDLLRFYSQIVNLKTLLDQHVSLGKFFPFLERSVNQRVSYDIAFLNTQTRELILEGVAESYMTLSEELQAIHQSTEIASYTLSQSQMSEGRVRFRIVATLVPALFK